MKYLVEFYMTDNFDVIVDADSEEEAAEVALELITQSEEPVKDYGTSCNGFQQGLITEHKP